jgi:predicted amidohydrolase
MEKFAVSLVQTSLHWENADANYEHLQNAIYPIKNTDLIVLPEMFTSGFSMDPENNFDANGKALKWMQHLANTKDAALCGSIIHKQGSIFYNRLYFVKPDGSFWSYDKKHLFTLAGEEKVYTAGSERLLVEFRGWKILPYICYDLRFPVWCRNVEEAELMLFVANWPNRRAEAWKTLLKARAIENMCYVVGVNRVGDDGNGVYHSGDSSVYDELGKRISEIKPGEEVVETIFLSKSQVSKSRERFSFLADRDDFKIL